MRSINRIIFVTLLLAFVFAAQDARGQETERLERLAVDPNAPTFEQDITVRLQLIDVTAVDSDGNYVKDLAKEDFQIFVNAEQQQIRTFDVYFPNSDREAYEAARAQGVVPYASMPTRRIVLFFDQAFSSVRGLRNARQAALEFVRRNLSPGDQVMVVRYYRSVDMIQNFTSDRDAMEEAINQVGYGIGSARVGDITFMSENEFDVRLYFEAMRKFSLWLKTFAGRKTLVMLSEGFDQRIALSSLSYYMREMLDRFNDAATTIFTVDVHGVQAENLAASRIRSYRHDTLAVFANETGGKFYRGSNNVENLLLGVDSDISHYYVLGFRADDEADGRYREVDVRTTRPGVRLRARAGYFAQKPFDDMDGDERLVHLEAGFNSNVPSNAIGAAVAVNVYPLAGGAVGTLLVEAPVGGREEPEFEILAYAVSREGVVVDVVHRLFEFRPRPEQGTWRHFDTLSLAEGENLIKVGVRDNRSGVRGYQFLLARVPESGEGMRLSTMAFIPAGQAPADSASARYMRSFKDRYDVPESVPADPLAPLRREGIDERAGSVFDADEPLRIAFRVGNLGSYEGTPRLVTSYSLRREDGASFDPLETDLQIFTLAGSSDAIVLSALDLEDVPAGSYLLRVTVENAETGELAGQRSQIELR